MNRFLILPVALLLLAACGAEPEEAAPVSALDVLPDETLLTLVVVDPGAAVEAMDAYAAGVPLLGETMVSDWLLTALDCADMQEVSARYGIETGGTLVVYMQSLMPQSIGAALPVTDPALFWAMTGVQPAADEPIGHQEVASFDVDFGKIYTCSRGGLLLIAGSRAGLQGMLERIDGIAPVGLPGLPDGSVYGYARISTFGPMAAQQIETFRPQILAEMQGGGGNAEMTANVMDLYFDAIGIFLRQTESADFLATFDPEYIHFSSTTMFVQGSDLAGLFGPVEVRDMTSMIPAGGVAAARISLDPASSAALMEAVIGGMGIDSIPPEMISFWALLSRNTAISILPGREEPFCMIAVYEMPEGSDLEQVMEMYRGQFDLMDRLLDLPGLTFVPVRLVELEGREWVTFGMDLDLAAITEQMSEAPIDSSMPALPGIAWTAWLTESDGVLYLEMGPEPVTVPALLDGTWSGETAASMAEMSGISPDAEVGAVVNLPEYFNWTLGMTGLGLPRIDAEPVWMVMETDFQEGRVIHHCRMDGSALVAFIGQAAQTIGAMGIE